MKNNLLGYLVKFSFAAFLSLLPALGQTVNGSITGQVTDKSAALVVGAQVTAENTATSVRTAVKTNASGVYTLIFFPSETIK